jgi:hypothetical protein
MADSQLTPDCAALVDPSLLRKEGWKKIFLRATSKTLLYRLR